jgi:hypothetical protein
LFPDRDAFRSFSANVSAFFSFIHKYCWVSPRKFAQPATSVCPLCPQRNNSLMNRRARAFLIVSVLAAVGTVVTVLLYIDTRNGETSLAHESFKGEFSSLLSEFKGFMAGQLRGLGAISDAISSHDSLPSAPVFQRVRSMFWCACGRWTCGTCLAGLR